MFQYWKYKWSVGKETLGHTLQSHRGNGTEAWSERTADPKHLLVDDWFGDILCLSMLDILGLFENGSPQNFMSWIMIHIDSSNFPPEKAYQILVAFRSILQSHMLGLSSRIPWAIPLKKPSCAWNDRGIWQFEDNVTGLRKMLATNRTFKNWWSFTRTAVSMASLLMLTSLDWIGDGQSEREDSFNIFQ